MLSQLRCCRGGVGVGSRCTVDVVVRKQGQVVLLPAHPDVQNTCLNAVCVVIQIIERGKTTNVLEPFQIHLIIFCIFFPFISC